MAREGSALLRRCSGWIGRVREIIHRSLHAALAAWNARKREAHLDAGKRSDDGEIVRIAEMTDAEHLAGNLGQPGAERHVEVFERDLPERICIAPGRHHQ